MKLHSSNSKVRKSGPLLAGITAAAAGLAVSGLYVREEIRRAERDHPSAGNFMNVNGVLLHFIDTNGSNPALVIFHGNGAMISDMQISGLLGRAAEKYRVILFDRPGYGYSDRPSDRTWGPFEQADLFHRALAQLGVVRPLIFGHSSGTQVALAMALDFPDDVGGLVLASGYYFPTPRADALSAAPVTIPVLGDFLRHTIIPLVGRLTAAGMFRKMFAPQPVPPRFLAEFPVGLTLRPSQLKANSEETVLMISAASKLEDRYDELHCPVCIMTGADDKIVDPERQSIRLHKVIKQSELRVFPGLGHMIHYFVADQAIEAIDSMAKATQQNPRQAPEAYPTASVAAENDAMQKPRFGNEE